MSAFVQFHKRLVDKGPEGFLEKTVLLLLIPLSFLYGSIMWVRSLLYRTNILTSFRSNLPVISVGNLAAGGTGKTPFVDYLLHYFENKGFRPAVVSRGYGGSFAGKMFVVSDGEGPLCSADFCGDESYLLAKKHPRATVLIAPRRRDAIKFLGQQKEIDIVILDDAFQHLQASRNINIVLLDAEKPYSNGFPLPAGLLREFPATLKRADLVVLTRSKSNQRLPDVYGLPLARCRHQICLELRTLSGDRVDIKELNNLQGVAFAGIANADHFFAGLKDEGLTLKKECNLPDHVIYTLQRLKGIQAAGESVDYYITTEKDAAKLTADSFDKPCYVVDMKLEFIDKSNLSNLLDNLCERMNMEVSDKLLEILACPKCKKKVTKKQDEIVCDGCRLAFPIRDGIPVMLIDEAVPFSE